VGSPSQHCTETRKVRSFSVLFACSTSCEVWRLLLLHSQHEFGTKFLSISLGIASNRLQIWVAGAAIHSRLHEFAKKNKFRNGFFLALAIAVDKRFSFENGAELCMRDCAKR